MTQLKTLVSENHWLPKHMKIGWGNGYVLLPKEHKYHGIHYNYLNDKIDVHGGLTFSEKVSEEMIQAFNQNPVMELLTEEDLGKWMIGFDTAHYGDSLDNWSKEAVEAETQRLYNQLIPKQLNS